jgi:hypothetical protein
MPAAGKYGLLLNKVRAVIRFGWNSCEKYDCHTCNNLIQGLFSFAVLNKQRVKNPPFALLGE